MLSTAAVNLITASRDSVLRRENPDTDMPAMPMEAPKIAA
jgi:hypothetical protein